MSSRRSFLKSLIAIPAAICNVAKSTPPASDHLDAIRRRFLAGFNSRGRLSAQEAYNQVKAAMYARNYGMTQERFIQVFNHNVQETTNAIHNSLTQMCQLREADSDGGINAPCVLRSAAPTQRLSRREDTPKRHQNPDQTGGSTLLQYRVPYAVRSK